MTREQRREALKQRINAAKTRLDDRGAHQMASDAADAAIAYAKQNPLIVLGGAAAIGVTVYGLTRSGGKAVKSGGVFTRIATDAVIAFALAMFEKANQRDEVGIAKGQDLIENQGNVTD